MVKQEAVRSTDEYLRRVGAILRRERNRQNLPLRGFKDRCGVSKDMVFRIEKGRDVPLGDAFRIAAALGLSPGVVFNPFNSESQGEEQPAPA
jgi:transcriptional regulator with XRE-family HTH domain